jgi:hypothetical protein
MYNLPAIAESIDACERLVRTEKDDQIQRRFHMLLLLSGAVTASSTYSIQHLLHPALTESPVEGMWRC